MFSTNHAGATTNSASYDLGLRQYMLYIYQNMSIALFITAVVALFTASSPAILSIVFGTPLKWVLMFAPIGFVMVFSAKIGSMSVQSARNCFWIFAAVMGISLSSIFLVYTATSITKTFFITASTFGAMSIYGQTTKKDLSKMASFMMMGVIGILIASVINIFTHSSALQFAISVCAVVVFTGLTAYDTQKLKYIYNEQGGNSDMSKKIAIFGALTLYFDFINIFLHLLQLIGEERK